MIVNTETFSKVVDSDRMTVRNTWRPEEIAISFGDNTFSFSPRDVVEIWRVMKGEKGSAEIQYAKHGLIDKISKLRIWYEEDDDGYKWNLRFTDDFKVVLDANEALALSWAIEGQVALNLFGLCGGNQQFQPINDVWVLSSRVMLTGDCAEDVDSERLGGFERVFVDRESAMDNVRDLLRELVNESYPESHWETNPDVNVDDILDKIMDDPPKLISGTQYWTYDGLSKSFEVKLCKRKIEARGRSRNDHD